MSVALLSRDEIQDIIKETALAVVENLRNDLRKESDWVDKAGLAKHFKCSPATINRWMRNGIPFERIGDNGHPRFKISEAEGWLSERI